MLTVTGGRKATAKAAPAPLLPPAMKAAPAPPVTVEPAITSTSVTDEDVVSSLVASVEAEGFRPMIVASSCGRLVILEEWVARRLPTSLQIEAYDGYPVREDLRLPATFAHRFYETHKACVVERRAGLDPDGIALSRAVRGLYEERDAVKDHYSRAAKTAGYP